VGTRFANAHGLPNENHYTTVWDFAQITLEAIEHSEFMTICDTVSYTVPPTNLSDQRVLQNSNGLINENSPTYPGYKYEYAHGIKTGYTSAAGYCLVSTAEREGVQLLCVLMGGVYTDENGKASYSNFTDSRTLYEWGFENFSFQNVLSVEETVGRVPVSMGADADSVALRPQNDLTAFLPNDTELSAFQQDVKVTAENEDGVLRAPIAAGEVLGTVTVSSNGVSYGTVNLVAASAVEMSKLSYLRSAAERVLSLFWVKAALAAAAVLLVIYLLIVLLYRRRRRQYIRAKRAEQKRRRAARSAAAAAPEQPTDAQQTASARETVPADAPQESAQPRPRRAVDDEYFNEFFRK